MNNINTEDGVRIAKEFVNLFVDEGKRMVDNGYKDHDKDLTEKDNIHADGVGNKIDPEEDIKNWLRHSLPDKRQLVNCGQNCPVCFITDFVAWMSTQFPLLFSDLQSILRKAAVFAEESVVVALEDEESCTNVKHDLPSNERFPGETYNTFIWPVRQQIPKLSKNLRNLASFKVSKKEIY